MNPADELNRIEEKANSAHQGNGRADGYIKALFELAVFYVRWQISRAASIESTKRIQPKAAR